jgi:hypothetical protein
MDRRHAARQEQAMDFPDKELVVIEELFVATTIAHVPFTAAVVIQAAERGRVDRQVNGLVRNLGKHLT